MVKKMNNLQETTKLIEKWAADRNLITADPFKQTLKLGEEFGELCQGLAKGNMNLAMDSIGDMFVVLTILSKQLGTNIEDCVSYAYNEIKDRRGKMVNGIYIKESDLPNN
jgi:NTP pyrophosphatase (non-canonical NTP hydrolase)